MEFKTWKSVKAEVYFKMCLGRNGLRCKIFGKTKYSYCSIFCYLIHFFLTIIKPEIRVHSMFMWGFYLFKWRTFFKKKKVKIMDKSKLRIHVCVQYASLRILEEILLRTRGVEIYCILYEWRIVTFYCLTEWRKLADNTPKLLHICWWKTWKAHNI